MSLLVIIIAVLGFVTVAGLGFVFAGGDGSSARTAKRAQAVTAHRDVQKLNRTRAAHANDPAQRRKQLVKSLKEQDRIQRKATFSLSARLLQAGLNFGPQTFWIISGVVGVLAFGGGLMFQGAIVVRALIALGAAFVFGVGLPRWVIGFLAKRRAKKFTAVFSDAIDIIVRGIKTGLPVHDCLKIISHESPAPLGPEFQRLVENLSMGLSMEQGLEKMFERMPTPELRFFTIVLGIQQKTGGNLAEALGNLSAILRARKLMREKVKALSSEATASAMIIGAMPPGVVIMVWITTPTYMMPMFTDPRGHMMLLVSAIWMSMGIFVMRRMINFDI